MAGHGFEQFVGQSLPALMRHAHALTGDVHAAEDLVQDTLVRMAGAWRRVDRDGNPLGYARTVMFRIYLSRWRRLRRRPSLHPLVETAATGDAYAEVDMRDSLRRGLAHLPRLQRAVLVLSFLDDMADADIAVAAGPPARHRPLPARPAGSLATFTAGDRLAFLATPPPGHGPEPSEKDTIVPATDGTFWTRCGGVGCVRVTRDQGTTWQSSRSPPTAAPPGMPSPRRPPEPSRVPRHAGPMSRSDARHPSGVQTRWKAGR